MSGHRALALAGIGVVLPALPLVLAWLAGLGVVDVFTLFGPLLMIAGVTIAHALSLSTRALFGRLPWTIHDRSFAVAFALLCVALSSEVAFAVLALS